MKTKKVIENLKILMQPYIPFWPKWSKHPDCTLNQDDLYIVEIHVKNKFKINLFESFMFYNQCKHIERINAKLRWDRKKFKEWIIGNFLFNVVELAQKNEGQSYLHKPIGTLELRDDIKRCLLRLNILYLNQIFEIYKEQDFEEEKIFKVILEFETLNQRNHLATYKTSTTN